MLRTRTLGAATIVALLLSTTTVLANDIVISGGRVTDPETGLDATFENANQLTIGVQTVIVNGGFSVRDSQLVLDAPNDRPIRNAQID